MRWALITAAMLLPGVASAQTPPPALTIDPAKPYRHEPSGLIIPLTLDNLPRVKAGAFAPAHLDEDFNFNTPDMSEDITVFVFRNVSGSTSVWFDRVAKTIAARDIFGGLIAAAPAKAFAPPGQSTASGLLATWRPRQGRYRSTGAALMSLGPDWYVALRYSSAMIDPIALEGRLRGAITALGWPALTTAQPAAVVVADCATPLALSGGAEQVASGKDEAMTSAFDNAFAAAGANVPGKHDVRAPSLAARWCREPVQYALPVPYGVYRPDGANDRYLLAFGDAGRGLWVAPHPARANAGELGKPAAPR